MEDLVSECEITGGSECKTQRVCKKCHMVSETWSSSNFICSDCGNLDSCEIEDNTPPEVFTPLPWWQTGYNLIKEGSMYVGGELVDKQRSCRKCRKFFSAREDDDYMKLWRELSDLEGNMSLCWDCDAPAKEKKQVKQYKWNGMKSEKKSEKRGETSVARKLKWRTTRRSCSS